MKHKSSSPDETKKIAGDVLTSILKKEKKQAFVLGLSGNLGSGKTAFMQGFIKAAGIQKTVTSPTFVLMQKYIQKKNLYTIFHLDAYRLHTKKELDFILPKNIWADPKNIICIEWPEQISELRRRCDLFLSFSYGKKETERILTIPSYEKK